MLAVCSRCFAPAAALGGHRAARAQTEALAHQAAREAVAGALLEHTARGERARIARELHDVVAHHVSMVAVQAETARLTTPGMPAAGARRLAGDRRHRPRGAHRDAAAAGVLREDAEDEPPTAAAAQPEPAQRACSTRRARRLQRRRA